MAIYLPGQRVLLRSDKTGVITKILLDHALAMNTRYQVALDQSNVVMGINGLDVLGALPPLAESFFARQRLISREVLGGGAGKVASSKSLFTTLTRPSRGGRLAT